MDAIIFSIFLMFSILCFVIGIAFFTGKILPLIKGYHTLSKSEKSKIKANKLCKNISIAFIAISFIFLIAAFSINFRVHYFKTTFIVWLIACILDIIYIEKSGKYIVKNIPK